MKNIIGIFLIALIFFTGCSDRDFNSDIWKTNKDQRFYMLNDIVKNKILIGKTKQEIIELLDTVDIKRFNYTDNSWMYIVSIPYLVPVPQQPIKVMDIEFENNKVKQTTIRN